MSKKLTLMLLVLVFATGNLLAGCTKTPVVVEPTTPKILRLVQSSPGATYNSQMAALAVDTAIVGYIAGRLYTWLPTDDRLSAYLGPELADTPPIDVNGDGKVWRIPIYPNAKWANGDPINADTFIYSFKTQLDPVMVNTQGLSLARQYIEIVNAADYFSQGADGPLKWEDVGIKKIDDYTIEITCITDYSPQEVMRHFSSFSKAPVYEPLYEQFMNATHTETQYGTDVDKIMCSGPFALITWVKGSEVIMEKNQHYRYADMVKLDQIVYHTIEDGGTQIQMFENGELDSISLPATDVEKYADDPRFRYTSSRYVRTLEMNHTNPEKPILDNPNFRKAMYYAIDRDTLAQIANAIAAPLLVPTTSIAYSDGTIFRDIADKAGYLPPNNGYDPTLALDYFNTALSEEGIDKVELTLNYASTTARNVIIGEFLQESLPTVFGADRFKLNLNPIPSAQSLDIMKSSPTNPSAYEMALAAWSLAATDFDPTAVFITHTSDYNRRNGPYDSERLDALFQESVSDPARKDERRLAELAMEMEKVFLDEVIAIPTIQDAGGALRAERVIPIMLQEHISAGWLLKFADLQVK